MALSAYHTEIIALEVIRNDIGTCGAYAIRDDINGYELMFTVEDKTLSRDEMIYKILIEAIIHAKDEGYRSIEIYSDAFTLDQIRNGHCFDEHVREKVLLQQHVLNELCASLYSYNTQVINHDGAAALYDLAVQTLMLSLPSSSNASVTYPPDNAISDISSLSIEEDALSIKQVQPSIKQVQPSIKQVQPSIKPSYTDDAILLSMDENNARFDNMIDIDGKRRARILQVFKRGTMNVMLMHNGAAVKAKVTYRGCSFEFLCHRVNKIVTIDVKHSYNGDHIVHVIDK